MPEWRPMTYTTVRSFWLNSYCLSCVWSVASSLSSSNAMFLLTERAGQSTFWNETTAFVSPDLLPPNSTDLNPGGYKNMRINAAAGIASSWCQWTEAALNRCLASFWAKRHRWRSWWVAQMSPRVNLCKNKTIWAFNLTQNNAYVVLHVLFVNFVNIKQVLL